MQTIQTWAGMDVSAKTLAVCRRRNGTETEQTFGNDADGHRELIKWLGKAARICMEATGEYHRQAAMALAAAGAEVMIVNPRVAKDFGRAMSSRSKTDQVDARVLLEYVRRMEFQAWQAPSAAVLELRELGRRMGELTQQLVDEKNRLHARRAAGISAAVIADVKQHVAHID